MPCHVQIIRWASLVGAGALAMASAATRGETPDDASVRQRLQELAGPEFQIHETEHFLIAFDTSDEKLFALRSRLEATHDSVERFCRINDIPTKPLEARLGVLFFGRAGDYGRYASTMGFAHGGTAGFYSQNNNTAAFLDSDDLPELSERRKQMADCQALIEELKARRPVDTKELRYQGEVLRSLTHQWERLVEMVNRTTVQHEVAHQLFFNLGVHIFEAQNPGWLVEGIACLFETPPSASGAGVGTINQMRLRDFRTILGGGDPTQRVSAADLPAAYSSGKFLPLQELISDAHLFGRRNDANLVHYYTQGWSLVTYLQRKHRKSFAEYLRVLAARTPGQKLTPKRELADFEAAFGELDDKFEQRWCTYIVNLKYKPSEAGG